MESSRANNPVFGTAGIGLIGLTQTHEEISTSIDVSGYAPGMMRIDDRRAFDEFGRIEVGVDFADGLGELLPRGDLLTLFWLCLETIFFSSDRDNRFEGMVGWV
jgi:hypothetical protein